MSLEYFIKKTIANIKTVGYKFISLSSVTASVFIVISIIFINLIGATNSSQTSQISLDSYSESSESNGINTLMGQNANDTSSTADPKQAPGGVADDAEPLPAQYMFRSTICEITDPNIRIGRNDSDIVNRATLLKSAAKISCTDKVPLRPLSKYYRPTVAHQLFADTSSADYVLKDEYYDEEYFKNNPQYFDFQAMGYQGFRSKKYKKYVLMVEIPKEGDTVSLKGYKKNKLKMFGYANDDIYPPDKGFNIEYYMTKEFHTGEHVFHGDDFDLDRLIGFQHTSLGGYGGEGFNGKIFFHSNYDSRFPRKDLPRNGDSYNYLGDVRNSWLSGAVGKKKQHHGEWHRGPVQWPGDGNFSIRNNLGLGDTTDVITEFTAEVPDKEILDSLNESEQDALCTNYDQTGKCPKGDRKACFLFQAEYYSQKDGANEITKHYLTRTGWTTIEHHISKGEVSEKLKKIAFKNDDTKTHSFITLEDRINGDTKQQVFCMYSDNINGFKTVYWGNPGYGSGMSRQKNALYRHHYQDAYEVELKEDAWESAKQVLMATGKAIQGGFNIAMGLSGVGAVGGAERMAGAARTKIGNVGKKIKNKIKSKIPKTKGTSKKATAPKEVTANTETFPHAPSSVGSETVTPGSANIAAKNAADAESVNTARGNSEDIPAGGASENQPPTITDGRGCGACSRDQAVAATAAHHGVPQEHPDMMAQAGAQAMFMAAAATNYGEAIVNIVDMFSNFQPQEESVYGDNEEAQQATAIIKTALLYDPTGIGAGASMLIDSGEQFARIAGAGNFKEGMKAEYRYDFFRVDAVKQTGGVGDEFFAGDTGDCESSNESDNYKKIYNDRNSEDVMNYLISNGLNNKILINDDMITGAGKDDQLTLEMCKTICRKMHSCKGFSYTADHWDGACKPKDVNLCMEESRVTDSKFQYYHKSGEFTTSVTRDPVFIIAKNKDFLETVDKGSTHDVHYDDIYVYIDDAVLGSEGIDHASKVYYASDPINLYYKGFVIPKLFGDNDPVPKLAGGDFRRPLEPIRKSTESDEIRFACEPMIDNAIEYKIKSDGSYDVEEYDIDTTKFVRNLWCYYATRKGNDYTCYENKYDIVTINDITNNSSKYRRFNNDDSSVFNYSLTCKQAFERTVDINKKYVLDKNVVDVFKHMTVATNLPHYNQYGLASLKSTNSVLKYYNTPVKLQRLYRFTNFKESSNLFTLYDYSVYGGDVDSYCSDAKFAYGGLSASGGLGNVLANEIKRIKVSYDYCANSDYTISAVPWPSQSKRDLAPTIDGHHSGLQNIPYQFLIGNNDKQKTLYIYDVDECKWSHDLQVDIAYKFTHCGKQCNNNDDITEKGYNLFGRITHDGKETKKCKDINYNTLFTKYYVNIFDPGNPYYINPETFVREGEYSYLIKNDGIFKAEDLSQDVDHNKAILYCYIASSGYLNCKAVRGKLEYGSNGDILRDQKTGMPQVDMNGSNVPHCVYKNIIDQDSINDSKEGFFYKYHCAYNEKDVLSSKREDLVTPLLYHPMLKNRVATYYRHIGLSNRISTDGNEGAFAMNVPREINTENCDWVDPQAFFFGYDNYFISAEKEMPVNSIFTNSPNQTTLNNCIHQTYTQTEDSISNTTGMMYDSAYANHAKPKPVIFDRNQIGIYDIKPGDKVNGVFTVVNDNEGKGFSDTTTGDSYILLTVTGAGRPGDKVNIIANQKFITSTTVKPDGSFIQPDIKVYTNLESKDTSKITYTDIDYIDVFSVVDLKSNEDISGHKIGAFINGILVGTANNAIGCRQAAGYNDFTECLLRDYDDINNEVTCRLFRLSSSGIHNPAILDQYIKLAAGTDGGYDVNTYYGNELLKITKRDELYYYLSSNACDLINESEDFVVKRSVLPNESRFIDISYTEVDSDGSQSASTGSLVTFKPESLIFSHIGYVMLGTATDSAGCIVEPDYSGSEDGSRNQISCYYLNDFNEDSLDNKCYASILTANGQYYSGVSEASYDKEIPQIHTRERGVIAKTSVCNLLRKFNNRRENVPHTFDHVYLERQLKSPDADTANTEEEVLWKNKRAITFVNKMSMWASNYLAGCAIYNYEEIVGGDIYCAYLDKYYNSDGTEDLKCTTTVLDKDGHYTKMEDVPLVLCYDIGYRTFVKSIEGYDINKIDIDIVSLNFEKDEQPEGYKYGDEFEKYLMFYKANICTEDEYQNGSDNCKDGFFSRQGYDNFDFITTHFGEINLGFSNLYSLCKLESADESYIDINNKRIICYHKYRPGSDSMGANGPKSHDDSNDQCYSMILDENGKKYYNAKIENIGSTSKIVEDEDINPDKTKNPGAISKCDLYNQAFNPREGYEYNLRRANLFLNAKPDLKPQDNNLKFFNRTEEGKKILVATIGDDLEIMRSNAMIGCDIISGDNGKDPSNVTGIKCTSLYHDIDDELLCIDAEYDYTGHNTLWRYEIVGDPENCKSKISAHKYFDIAEELSQDRVGVIAIPQSELYYGKGKGPSNDLLVTSYWGLDEAESKIRVGGQVYGESDIHFLPAYTAMGCDFYTTKKEYLGKEYSDNHMKCCAISNFYYPFKNNGQATKKVVLGKEDTDSNNSTYNVGNDDNNGIIFDDKSPYHNIWKLCNKVIENKSTNISTGYPFNSAVDSEFNTISRFNAYLSKYCTGSPSKYDANDNNDIQIEKDFSCSNYNDANGKVISYCNVLSDICVKNDKQVSDSRCRYCSSYYPELNNTYTKSDSTNNNVLTDNNGNIVDSKCNIPLYQMFNCSYDDATKQVGHEKLTDDQAGYNKIKDIIEYCDNFVTKQKEYNSITDSSVSSNAVLWQDYSKFDSAVTSNLIDFSNDSYIPEYNSCMDFINNAPIKQVNQQYPDNIAGKDCPSEGGSCPVIIESDASGTEIVAYYHSGSAEIPDTNNKGVSKIELARADLGMLCYRHGEQKHTVCYSKNFDNCTRTVHVGPNARIKTSDVLRDGEIVQTEQYLEPGTLISYKVGSSEDCDQCLIYNIDDKSDKKTDKLFADGNTCIETSQRFEGSNNIEYTYVNYMRSIGIAEGETDANGLTRKNTGSINKIDFIALNDDQSNMIYGSFVLDKIVNLASSDNNKISQVGVSLTSNPTTDEVNGVKYSLYKCQQKGSNVPLETLYGYSLTECKYNYGRSQVPKIPADKVTTIKISDKYYNPDIFLRVYMLENSKCIAYEFKGDLLFGAGDYKGLLDSQSFDYNKDITNEFIKEETKLNDNDVEKITKSYYKDMVDDSLCRENLKNSELIYPLRVDRFNLTIDSKSNNPYSPIELVYNDKHANYTTGLDIADTEEVNGKIVYKATGSTVVRDGIAITRAGCKNINQGISCFFYSEPSSSAPQSKCNNLTIYGHSNVSFSDRIRKERNYSDPKFGRYDKLEEVNVDNCLQELDNIKAKTAECRNNSDIEQCSYIYNDRLLDKALKAKQLQDTNNISYLGYTYNLNQQDIDYDTDKTITVMQLIFNNKTININDLYEPSVLYEDGDNISETDVNNSIFWNIDNFNNTITSKNINLYDNSKKDASNFIGNFSYASDKFDYLYDRRAIIDINNVSQSEIAALNFMPEVDLIKYLSCDISNNICYIRYFGLQTGELIKKGFVNNIWSDNNLLTSYIKIKNKVPLNMYSFNLGSDYELNNDDYRLKLVKELSNANIASDNVISNFYKNFYVEKQEKPSSCGYPNFQDYKLLYSKDGFKFKPDGNIDQDKAMFSLKLGNNTCSEYSPVVACGIDKENQLNCLHVSENECKLYKAKLYQDLGTSDSSVEIYTLSNCGLNEDQIQNTVIYLQSNQDIKFNYVVKTDNMLSNNLFAPISSNYSLNIDGTCGVDSSKVSVTNYLDYEHTENISLAECLDNCDKQIYPTMCNSVLYNIKYKTCYYRPELYCTDSGILPEEIQDYTIANNLYFKRNTTGKLANMIARIAKQQSDYGLDQQKIDQIKAGLSDNLDYINKLYINLDDLKRKLAGSSGYITEYNNVESCIAACNDNKLCKLLQIDVDIDLFGNAKYSCNILAPDDTDDASNSKIKQAINKFKSNEITNKFIFAKDIDYIIDKEMNYVYKGFNTNRYITSMGKITAEPGNSLNELQINPHDAYNKFAASFYFQQDYYDSNQCRDWSVLKPANSSELEQIRNQIPEIPCHAQCAKLCESNGECAAYIVSNRFNNVNNNNQCSSDDCWLMTTNNCQDLDMLQDSRRWLNYVENTTSTKDLVKNNLYQLATSYDISKDFDITNPDSNLYKNYIIYYKSLGDFEHINSIDSELSVNQYEDTYTKIIASNDKGGIIIPINNVSSAEDCKQQCRNDKKDYCLGVLYDSNNNRCIINGCTDGLNKVVTDLNILDVAKNPDSYQCHTYLSPTNDAVYTNRYTQNIESAICDQGYQFNLPYDVNNIEECAFRCARNDDIYAGLNTSSTHNHNHMCNSLAYNNTSKSCVLNPCKTDLIDADKYTYYTKKYPDISAQLTKNIPEGFKVINYGSYCNVDKNNLSYNYGLYTKNELVIDKISYDNNVYNINGRAPVNQWMLTSPVIQLIYKNKTVSEVNVETNGNWSIVLDSNVVNNELNLDLLRFTSSPYDVYIRYKSALKSPIGIEPIGNNAIIVNRYKLVKLNKLDANGVAISDDYTIGVTKYNYESLVADNAQYIDTNDYTYDNNMLGDNYWLNLDDCAARCKEDINCYGFNFMLNEQAMIGSCQLFDKNTCNYEQYKNNFELYPIMDKSYYGQGYQGSQKVIKTTFVSTASKDKKLISDSIIDAIVNGINIDVLLDNFDKINIDLFENQFNTNDELQQLLAQINQNRANMDDESKAEIAKAITDSIYEDANICGDYEPILVLNDNNSINNNYPINIYSIYKNQYNITADDTLGLSYDRNSDFSPGFETCYEKLTVDANCRVLNNPSKIDSSSSCDISDLTDDLMAGLYKVHCIESTDTLITKLKDKMQGEATCEVSSTPDVEPAETGDGSLIINSIEPVLDTQGNTIIKINGTGPIGADAKLVYKQLNYDLVKGFIVSNYSNNNFTMTDSYNIKQQLCNLSDASGYLIPEEYENLYIKNIAGFDVSVDAAGKWSLDISNDMIINNLYQGISTSDVYLDGRLMFSVVDSTLSETEIKQAEVMCSDDANILSDKLSIVSNITRSNINNMLLESGSKNNLKLIHSISINDINTIYNSIANKVTSVSGFDYSDIEDELLDINTNYIKPLIDKSASNALGCYQDAKLPIIYAKPSLNGSIDNTTAQNIQSLIADDLGQNFEVQDIVNYVNNDLNSFAASVTIRNTTAFDIPGSEQNAKINIDPVQNYAPCGYVININKTDNNIDVTKVKSVQNGNNYVCSYDEIINTTQYIKQVNNQSYSVLKVCETGSFYELVTGLNNALINNGYSAIEVIISDLDSSASASDIINDNCNDNVIVGAKIPSPNEGVEFVYIPKASIDNFKLNTNNYQFNQVAANTCFNINGIAESYSGYAVNSNVLMDAYNSMNTMIYGNNASLLSTPICFNNYGIYNETAKTFKADEFGVFIANYLPEFFEDDQKLIDTKNKIQQVINKFKDNNFKLEFYLGCVDDYNNIDLLDISTACKADKDSDGDGLNDCKEEELGTDSSNIDSDADGLTDGEEVNGIDGNATDPLLSDTNNNSISDYDELYRPEVDIPNNYTQEDGVVYNQGDLITITGTAKSSINLAIKNTQNQDVIASTSVGNDGSWSIDLPDTLPSGRYEVRAVSSEQVGQNNIESTSDPVYIITIQGDANLAPPVISVIDKVNDTELVLNISGTTSPNTKIVLKYLQLDTTKDYSTISSAVAKQQLCGYLADPVIDNSEINNYYIKVASIANIEGNEIVSDNNGNWQANIKSQDIFNNLESDFNLSVTDIYLDGILMFAVVAIDDSGNNVITSDLSNILCSSDVAELSNKYQVFSNMDYNNINAVLENQNLKYIVNIKNKYITPPVNTTWQQYLNQQSQLCYQDNKLPIYYLTNLNEADSIGSGIVLDQKMYDLTQQQGYIELNDSANTISPCAKNISITSSSPTDANSSTVDIEYIYSQDNNCNLNTIKSDVFGQGYDVNNIKYHCDNTISASNIYNKLKISNFNDFQVQLGLSSNIIAENAIQLCDNQLIVAHITDNNIQLLAIDSKYNNSIASNNSMYQVDTLKYCYILNNLHCDDVNNPTSPCMNMANKYSTDAMKDFIASTTNDYPNQTPTIHCPSIYKMLNILDLESSDLSSAPSGINVYMGCISDYKSLDFEELLPDSNQPISGGTDSDGDGLSDDDEENIYYTDPQEPDSDTDGLNDGDEVNTYGSNPAEQDSDNDGLFDGDEVHTHGTNPINNDTDSDDISDGDEINNNTNPLDANDPPAPPDTP